MEAYVIKMSAGGQEFWILYSFSHDLKAQPGCYNQPWRKKRLESSTRANALQTEQTLKQTLCTGRKRCLAMCLHSGCPWPISRPGQL